MRRDQLLFAARAGIVGIIAALIYWYFPVAWLDPTPRIEIVHSARAPDAVGGADQRRGPFSYSTAVQAAAPAVVNIFTASDVHQMPGVDSPLFEELFGDRSGLGGHRNLKTSAGSGVIVSSGGYIVTNSHLIENSDEINVMLPGGASYPARVIGTDPDTDLAVLKINATALPVISLAAPDVLQVGDVVLAIGNPLGVGQTVTMGIVSATGRSSIGLNTFEDFIQTDAAINPGNSGGALINPHGELVGVNTAIFTSQGGGSSGLALAIPVDLVESVTEQIIQHGRVIRGWLGVVARDPTPRLRNELGLPERGVVVTGVVEKGPADLAGIQAGDVLLSVAEQRVDTPRTLLEITTAARPGTVVDLQTWRKGETFTTHAELIQRPLPVPGG